MKCENSFCDKDKLLNLRDKKFGQICEIHCFQFIYNYIIKNILCILKTPPRPFSKSCFKSGNYDAFFWKMYLENISQIINSSVGPTILWIAKQKKKTIFKYSYLTPLNTKFRILFLPVFNFPTTLLNDTFVNMLKIMGSTLLDNT